MEWIKLLEKKDRRVFIIITALHLTFFIMGVILIVLGSYSGVYGFLLPITYIPFYFSLKDLADTYKND